LGRRRIMIKLGFEENELRTLISFLDRVTVTGIRENIAYMNLIQKLESVLVAKEDNDKEDKNETKDRKNDR